ncbi:MAG: RimK/LysX family protein [Gammaproteobacteria bacterium]
MEDKLIVGWREWVALPKLGIPALKAKIDTGARTSALHVADLESYREQRRRKARFTLHPLRKNQQVAIICSADVIDERIVTDSGGRKEKRLVIRSPIRLAEWEWMIDITLTSREDMMFRMLLGRTAMAGRLIVDPALSFEYGRTLRAHYRDWPRHCPQN